MEILLKEYLRTSANRNATLIIDGKENFVKQYTIYGINPVDDLGGTIKLINSVKSAILEEDFDSFKRINVKHKSLPFYLAFDNWYTHFLELLIKVVFNKYAKSLPTNLNYKILIKDVVGLAFSNPNRIKYSQFIKDFNNITLHLCVYHLEKAIEDNDMVKFRENLKQISRWSTPESNSFVYDVALEMLGSKLETFVTKVGLDFANNYIEPTPNKLHAKIFVSGFVSRSKRTDYEICEKASLKIKDKYVSIMRSKKIDFESDKWEKFVERETGQFKKFTFDFSEIDMNLRASVKTYLKTLLDEGLEIKSLISNLYGIKRFIAFIKEHTEYSYLIPNIFKIKYSPHLTSIKASFEAVNPLGTVKNIFNCMGRYYDWLLLNNQKSHLENPFNKISFRNLDKYTKHTEDIPQEIVDVINENLHSLPPTFRNAWIILMNSGMRISELLSLQHNSLNFNEMNNQYELSYIPQKQEKLKRKNQEDRIHHVYVTPALKAAFDNQLEITSHLRTETNYQALFIHKYDGIRIISSSGFKYALNNLLQKQGITFKLTPHMCRKSMVVKLLSEGHTIEETSNITGQSISTILQSYFGIERKKLKEMESAFFDEAYDHLFKPKMNTILSEVEVEAIRTEIKIGSRKAPNGQGFCGKHVVFGPCVKNRCVGCRLLITTPEQIPLYRTMIDEQERYIESLTKQFTSMGIPLEEFTGFRDYQSEVNYLEVIRNGLDQLIDFVKEKLPQNEQERLLGT
ncbi:tyrosine-type recombinase/integrase [Fictibacillus sp. 26RED30]|uniref:tyrosine-type recombinase/integrase n=1 Tax=Fictibacillus sp. 26RED30 TaxID=2745877 RepID=UPI0018CD192F|nr:site-specific integrase [Fictibacillus sp. 26RED30]MBH0162083.1 site-specific integrase [Fictibacillus sp. 26RED30]